MIKRFIKFKQNIKGWSFIIPALMVLITNKPRQKEKIEWSHQSWVHNIFRVYEFIFWRRYGIKAEMSCSFDGKKAIYQCHSFEAFCALAETYIRTLLNFKFQLPIKIWIPMLMTTNGLPMPASPFLFAIAFDTSQFTLGTAGTNPSTETISYTTSGSNRLLVAFVYDNSTFTGEGGTAYNSVALNSNVNSVNTTTSTRIDEYSLANPATGANNFTANINSPGSSGGPLGYVLVSYTGVDQTTPIDSSAGFIGSGSSTSQTISTTVVAANCWLIGASHGSVATTAITSNRTDRQSGTNVTTRIFSYCMADSNATVATGSQSFVFTGAATDFMASMALSIAPSTAIATITNIPTLLMMGVG